VGTQTVVDTVARFAVLRYVPDLARDEPKNVGIILFTEDGYRGMRAVRPSMLSGRLREQGLLDRTLSSMAAELASVPTGLADLYRWRGIWSRSLQIDDPRPTAIYGSAQSTLDILYRGLVASRPRRSKRFGKAEVLDRIVDTLRNRGARVRRSDYLQDHQFDAIVESEAEDTRTVAALSFASGARDWTSVERDAGHFLYAASRVDARPSAVMQPPTDASLASAKSAYERVRRWFEREEVVAVELTDIETLARSIVPKPSTPDPLVLNLFGD
jgi:Protein of unknown function (DUF3037)